MQEDMQLDAMQCALYAVYKPPTQWEETRLGEVVRGQNSH